ncbi:MAG: methyl-accepting chemotaxis protein [Nostocaceae cyanobacterium]|nr:methyl-accepting chemotaxis protein [Nostocaceae cyanobacterium]
MATSTEDYGQEYQQAHKAYVQGNYQEAATLVDRAVEHSPEDPSAHLLRGHVYYVLQEYDVARGEYQTVLNLTHDPELIEFANNGLDYINQYEQQESVTGGTASYNDHSGTTDASSGQSNHQQPQPSSESLADFDTNGFDFSSFDEPSGALSANEYPSFESPFIPSQETPEFDTHEEEPLPPSGNNPFNWDSGSQTSAERYNSTSNDRQYDSWEDSPFWQEDNSKEPQTSGNYQSDSDYFGDFNSSLSWEYSGDSTLEDSGFPDNNGRTEGYDMPESQGHGTLYQFQQQNTDDETLLMGEETSSNSSSHSDSFGYSYQEPLSQDSAAHNSFSFNQQHPPSSEDSELNSHNSISYPDSTQPSRGFGNTDDSFDFDAFDAAFASDATVSMEDTASRFGGGTPGSNVEFLDDFDEFDDLGSMPGFNGAEDSSFGTANMTTSTLGSQISPNQIGDAVGYVQKSSIRLSDSGSSESEDELFSITGNHEAVPIFTQGDSVPSKPQVSEEQGWLAPLENSSLPGKQWIAAGTVGIVSALVVAAVSFTAANFASPQQRSGVRNTGWIMAIAAGITGFATSSIMGNLTLKQIRRTTEDLQAQFDAVRQGNLNVQATVYSEDEFGQLATGFNEMARVILTTTSEAQRKAQEQEEQKENLQRQVIRLLDDVEGAARGDLTVQAEVTADVLGAVADAFNLTIQNLRDIVQQVKSAAREVSRGATNSETFARALSSDALRQAEELAVTLNSVQMMTDSIQRVAKAAQEAETVARDASTIALKGGEAVERTVAGILEVRETVAETTRKVKRLAESTQEISKIVALISQIASRTNLLALNASIEAARAGEAGRGFAIVADEVRQLADKSAKSLKEIEQIVMQIQSETGSVMTAMEEGTQQVIRGTHLAEQAKRSLEDIIQVANRIDALVRSITADTVEQTETSRNVASVMQSVELTAQETSQEAQRVSGALQSLVGVSRDLLASVERFRVEVTESR